MNKHNQKCYTYLIGWSTFDIWYYGSRCANKLPPEQDLIFKYQTSSKIVKSFIQQNGLPDIVRIHKTFESKLDALTHERKFLCRVRARDSSRWLNQSNNSFPHVTYVMTDEVKIKMSNSHKARYAAGVEGNNKGRKFSQEWRDNISKGNKGKHSEQPWRVGASHSEDTKQKISKSLTGIKRSQETKDKVSQSKKGKKMSDEFRQKRSEIMKETWAKRKAANHSIR